MQTGLFKSFALAVVASFSLNSAAQADAAAERILATARYSATLQKQDLQGVMNKSGNKTPISLFLRGENIQFVYGPKRDKRFHMRLKQDRFDLLEIKNGKTVKFNNSKISQKIHGTDLSFEDLSMRFLYWKKNSVVGEEKVNSQNCYKVRLENPGKSGDYSIVYVWVHKKYGALMKVVGYNRGGKPLKRFQVTDLMKVSKGVYTLKRMRVETVNPTSRKTTGITYLEFQKPKKVTTSKPRR